MSGLACLGARLKLYSAASVLCVDFACGPKAGAQLLRVPEDFCLQTRPHITCLIDEGTWSREVKTLAIDYTGLPNASHLYQGAAEGPWISILSGVLSLSWDDICLFKGEDQACSQSRLSLGSGLNYHAYL